MRDGEAGRRSPSAASERTDGELAIDVGERQRQAHEREQRHARVAHRDRDIDHVGADRGAVPLRRRRSPAAARRRSPAASPWFSTRAQLVGRQVGVADDAAVGGDEGDAGAEDPAERIGLAVELGVASAAA